MNSLLSTLFWSYLLSWQMMYLVHNIWQNKWKCKSLYNNHWYLHFIALFELVVFCFSSYILINSFTRNTCSIVLFSIQLLLRKTLGKATLHNSADSLGFSLIKWRFFEWNHYLKMLFFLPTFGDAMCKLF
jgi:hypothetical protein